MLYTGRVGSYLISELHGNNNREYYFRAVASYEKTVHDHRTGRKCVRCGGDLLDSIVNFGEYLPAEPLRLARNHAKKTDLCLVLGSSLTVPPASGIPETVGTRKAAKLVICNLQETPLDGLVDQRIYSKADELMTRVMAKLDIPIPQFILRRRLIVQMETTGGSRHQLKICGVDVDGTPMTFLRSIKLDQYCRRAACIEPFTISFRSDLDIGTELKLELEFMGNYGEPNLEIIYSYTGEAGTEMMYLLEYNPQTGEWKTERQESQSVDEDKKPTRRGR
ncbi:NAD-dependent protein deacetylase SRT1 [Daldinia childiae]|uniref:NAD-dependent protein deacetylase SRT1 n=1 Tax=Daldinia childiae TaxID=326645 RepID=UPI001447F3DB|nr:NAD-dependent protein deacetylase SRT1 [Daldinia childiae]KAF3059425.1 NAD-dependent protein deacetylase SRT1 [Daldinia childiae]